MATDVNNVLMQGDPEQKPLKAQPQNQPAVECHGGQRSVADYQTRGQVAPVRSNACIAYFGETQTR